MLTEDSKYNTEIQKYLGIMKDSFQNLCKVLETMKRILNCYVISVLLYGSGCWAISSQMKKRLETREN